jgi:solute carrier family 35 protein E1
VLKLSLTGAAIMMKLLIVASAASAWSLGVPKGLPKLNNRALQQQRQQNQVIAAAPASTTALKATEVTGGAKAEDGLMETLKTGSFFALWYLFNIGYNIYNKRALNVLPMPWTLATLQLFAGIPYVLLLWSTGARKTPKLTQDNLKTLFPVACGHLGTHIGAVISLGAGAVSFTHIVKASEPVVSAALSAVMLGAFYSPITYLTLLPIVGGVALASLKELSFTWLGFGAAMLSNVSSALRGILAKKTMGGGVGENMNETNLYAVMTIMAFAVLLPVSLMVETPKAVGAAINTAVAAGTSKKDLAILSALSGAYYYLYNEVAFLALGRVNPVTHAVGNTIKRVVIIIASVIAFNTPISRLGVIGSSIAITGTLLYSLAKNKYG